MSWLATFWVEDEIKEGQGFEPWYRRAMHSMHCDWSQNNWWVQPPKYFTVNYNGTNNLMQTKDRIKVNGLNLFQKESLREDVNVNLAMEAMERLLLSWSASRLMLLGRILIVKTFAISNMIYLKQTLKLSEKNQKAFVKVGFKFLWNRNFNAARAPERLKRSIMFTPVKFHSFGMMYLNALSETLDFRSYGRLLATKHPFMAQLREQLNSNIF